jgi:hypothetical protein
MAKLKTKLTEVSVEDFIAQIPDEEVQEDCGVIVKLMKKATGSPAKMWGPSIIGFGQYHYKYESGHEGDMCLIGFAPRKANLALYGLLAAYDGKDGLPEKLGKYKTGKGCLYIKKLKDVDMKVLESMIQKAVIFLKKKHGGK